MTRKRNPIGNEFDKHVIDEMQILAGSIGDHLFLAREETERLKEYINAYDDGSWKFAFVADVNDKIYKIERQFGNIWEVLETFKDPE
jgi:hypothetical protein